jgi:hypothetical protein
MIFRLVRKHVLFFILLISQPLLMFAQENQPTQAFLDFLTNLQLPPKPGEGNITIHQDARLTEQVERLNETNSQKKGLAGFRINIFTAWGKDARTKMLSENSRFVASYENIQTYPSYDPPRWIIYVGDFYTRSAAEKVRQMIIKQFPKSFVRAARVKAPDIGN